MRNNVDRILRSRLTWIVLVVSIAWGLILALVDSSAQFFTDWFVYSTFLLFGLASLLVVGKALKASKGAWQAALAAYGLRVLVGIVLTILLPAAGYADNEATSAGYTFKDAYYRDAEAWRLAKSEDMLAAAFTPKYETDQYGGLLALSGFVYRYLSPDVQRPFSILLLTAMAGGLGTLFVWKAAKNWLGAGTAAVTAWIFALYPEGVLLGASQMREPFVMMSLALATYGFTQMKQEKRQWSYLILMAAVLLLFFQSPVALIVFFVIGAAWLIEPEKRLNWKAVGLFAAILFVALLVVITVWSNLPSLEEANPFTLFVTWLQHNFRFQSGVTESGSGHVQNLVDMVGEGGRALIFLLYGVARPVLPAALADTGTSTIWYIINFFRSSGWYLLAPILVYTTMKLLGRDSIERRKGLLWLSISAWVLILLAAANGGADAWDNPRYRAIFLPWQAVLAGWGLWTVRSQKDAWLGRWFLIEGIFVLLFTWWYITRQPELASLHPDIRVLVLACLAAAAVIIAGGWLLDRKKKQITSTVVQHE